MQKGRAVVFDYANRSLDVQQLEIRDPERGAVVAKVALGGVCGSDVHIRHGEIPLPYPIVLGHEGISRIEKLGSGVSADFAGVPVAPGDLIYWSPIPPCHKCYYCTVEQDLASCQDTAWFGPVEKPTWGSYADYVTLGPGMAFYRVPDGTPPEAVIALGCALPTVLQGLDRARGIKSMETVVVQGCGPVGLAAVMMASIAGAGTIIAMERSPMRLEFAKKFGATHCVALENSSAEDRRRFVHSLTGGRGATLVIECSGRNEAFSEGIPLLARDGRYLVIGLWASQGKMEFDPSEIVRGRIEIIGSVYSEPRHYHRAMMVAATHHREFPLTELVTHKYRLEDAEQALKIVETGRAGKVVMRPT
jgi:threonine dehydrogenase-like Zn-dependent dehydrogenase